MKTRIIHTKIHFEDDWFNTLPIGYKYLFIYLFTNSHIGQTGAYQLSARLALTETGASNEDWTEACRYFDLHNKVKFHKDWIYIVNSGRYANYSGGKNEVAYKKEYELIPQEVRDTLSIQYLYPMDTTINKKSEIINKKPEIINQKRLSELKEKAHSFIGRKV